MEPITRDEAIAAGMKRYFTGLPCSRGHIAQRRVSNHTCLQCHKEAQRELLSNNPDFAERQRQAAAAWKKSPYGKKRCRELDKAKKRDPIKERNRLRELQARKRATDVQHRIKAAISRRISWHINKGGKRTSDIMQEQFGYTIQELARHLEAQFTKGMNWGNYGKNGWHVDHITPVAEFDLTDQKQFAACWSLPNLRPLWANDNSQKGARRIFLI